MANTANFLGTWNGKLVCDDFVGYKASFELGTTEIGCVEAGFLLCASNDALIPASGDGRWALFSAKCFVKFWTDLSDQSTENLQKTLRFYLRSGLYSYNSPILRRFHSLTR